MRTSFATLPRMQRTIWLVIISALTCATSSMGFAAQSGSTNNAPTATQTPFYYTRTITNADLKGRNLRELSLMRNTIYARVGNKFRKKWLNDYFAQFSWYHPLDKMEVSKLTALDRANAAAIAQYDASLNRDNLLAERATLLKANTGNGDDKIELRLLSERLGTWSG